MIHCWGGFRRLAFHRNELICGCANDDDVDYYYGIAPDDNDDHNPILLSPSNTTEQSITNPNPNPDLIPPILTLKHNHNLNPGPNPKKFHGGLRGIPSGG